MMFAVALALMADTSTCLPCHKAQVEHFARTGMARAMETAEASEILRANPKLTYKLGRFLYSLTRESDRTLYSVTDGKDNYSVPIRYAFGLGAAGQTYVYQHNGNWYESRLSYYQEINGLDLTMGAPAGEPKNLLEAAGRQMTPKDADECFRCHTTKRGAELVPGVQCDVCHPGGDRHATAVRTRQPSKMTKLGAMSSEDMNNFCGQCHRTWEDIATNGPRGIGNVRFQPYRITNSKCFDTADARIKCTACHDPHADRARTAASYDAKCLACHAKSAKKASQCPKAAANCVSCHMPDVEMPGSHHKFSDHQIRIVRNKDEYPN